jgi:phage terminase large subunit GpA-like protein
MNPLSKGFKSAVRPPDRRKPWAWCEDHVVVDNTSPMPGRWRSDSSPWVKELMEVFPDNRVTDISVMCSAQSSKTQTLLNCSCWAISEDPGPAMWVMAAKDEAKTFVRDRVKPTFEGCKPVADLMISPEAYEFTFASMPFYFTGAGSPSKLQSKPIRWLFLDEVRNYPPGALDTVLKRTRAFWNSRRVLISTPDKKNDAVHRAFLAGDQRIFHFPCPGCSQLQTLKFEQLKGVHPDTGKVCKFNEVPGAKDERGKWNFDLLAEWIRYQCVACGHLIKDVPVERKAIARNGRFIRMNPKAPRHRVSFHWNALLPPWVSWRGIVEEFIQARSAARTGDLEPLKTFINETLGEPWDDQLGEIDDYDFLDLRKADYEFGDAWAEERVRFMAADKQEAGGEHYWWVIRAFGLFGKSRLIAYGRCNTKEELEEIRRLHRVKTGNSMMDAAFKASEVYRFCLATGWKAFKGDDADFFLRTDPRTRKAFRQIWTRNWADPHYGTHMAGRTKPIPLFRWSNNAAKDMLTEMMMGLIGDWTLPQKIGSDYLKQATAERREEKEDTKGRISYFWKQVRRDNHLRDCELMILIAAVITRMVQARAAKALN